MSDRTNYPFLSDSKSISFNIKMKAFHLFLFLLFSLSSPAQPVQLINGKFKIGNEDFHPLVLNYGFQIVKNTTGAVAYPAPVHSYGKGSPLATLPNTLFDCNNAADCEKDLRNDFNKIREMGFNAVRFSLSLRYYTDDNNKSRLGIEYASVTKNAEIAGINNKAVSQKKKLIAPNIEEAFSYYEKLMQIATEADLKIIFVLVSRSSSFNRREVQLYNDLINTIVSKIKTSKYRNSVFAFDLMNEPCYHDNSDKSKKTAYRVVNKWYETIKEADNTALVTLGTCGYNDIGNYDPVMLPVDFISLHTYPAWGQFENPKLPETKERSLKRHYADITWFSRICNKPWIIGETSLSADDINGLRYSKTGFVDYTEKEQADFYDASFKATYECGGSGYSWWEFQDGCDIKPPGQDNRSFLGLMRLCSHYEEKQIVSRIKDFNSQLPAVNKNSCAQYSDYTPEFNSNSVYYNPYNHPRSSNTIRGHITSSSGEPVKDAVIFAHTCISSENGKCKVTYPHYTFSDANGYYEVNSYDNLDDPNDPMDGKIINLNISAPGRSRINYGWSEHNLGELPENVVLWKIKY